jgi:hypothetical protein
VIDYNEIDSEHSSFIKAILKIQFIWSAIAGDYVLDRLPVLFLKAFIPNLLAQSKLLDSNKGLKL